jgi:hypothetical protein
MESNNPQLPAEIVNQIEYDAKKAATVVIWNDYDSGCASSARTAMGSRVDPIQKEFYIKGATEWAQWKVKHNQLEQKIDKILHDERNAMQLKLSEQCAYFQKEHQQLKERTERYENTLKSILNAPAPLCLKTHIAWVNAVRKECEEALKGEGRARGESTGTNNIKVRNVSQGRH